MSANDRNNLCVGVLAIQGAFQEHELALLKCSKEHVFDRSIELEIVKVTDTCHLQQLDGLIIPGGESTSIRKLLNDTFLKELSEWMKNERHAVFGTCAGLILLSKNIENTVEVDNRLTKLAMMEITTSRNFFGRQLNSFEGCVTIKEKSMLEENRKNNKPDVCSGVFIRAPVVLSIDGPSVETIATMQLPGQEKEVIVGVQNKNCIGLAFHPELTEDLQWHAYFLKVVAERKFK